MSLTSKQKKLARELVKGKNISEAGRKAGYTTRQAAHRTSKNPVVINYMNKVLDAVAKRQEMDKTDLQGAVSEVIQYECTDKPGIKLRGIELLMKSAGMLSDDKSVNVGVFAQMIPKLSTLDRVSPTEKLDIEAYIVSEEKGGATPPPSPPPSPLVDEYKASPQISPNFQFCKENKKGDMEEGNDSDDSDSPYYCSSLEGAVGASEPPQGKVADLSTPPDSERSEEAQKEDS